MEDLKSPSFWRAFWKGFFSVGIAPVRRFIFTPQEEMAAVRQELRWALEVAKGYRSPHCQLCSACHPDYPCDPDCHICWPKAKED